VYTNKQISRAYSLTAAQDVTAILPPIMNQGAAALEFEWDEKKRSEVQLSRGIDILAAALIFEGWVVTTADERNDYGEFRYRSIGMVDGECLVVVHATRGRMTRLITAWKANRNDRRAYENYLAERLAADEGSGPTGS
jgi:uncharacterized protein